MDRTVSEIAKSNLERAKDFVNFFYGEEVPLFDPSSPSNASPTLRRQNSIIRDCMKACRLRFPGFHFSVTRLYSKNAVRRDDEMISLRIHPIEKLKSTPQRKPISVSVQLNEDAKSFDKALLARTGGGWELIGSVLNRLSKEYELRSLEAARKFTGKKLSTAQEAESSVHIEIERRINQERLIPMIFERLPTELRRAIWRNVMDVTTARLSDAPQGSTLRAWSWADDVIPQSALFRTAKCFHTEAMETFYGGVTFTFANPHRLGDWLWSLRPSTRALIRRVKLEFDIPQLLRFFGASSMAASYDFPFLMSWDPYREEAPAILSLLSPIPAMRLFIVLPDPGSTFIFGQLEWSYESLCACIAKTVGSTVASMNLSIRAEFEAPSNLSSSAAEMLSAERIEELNRLASRPSGVSWE